MDVDAILARKPQVVLVDELAHTNIEGSRHRKRYEDVMEMLDAKIDVLSTMNVQHIESLTPLVHRSPESQVRETVPDWVMQRVDEIVLADLTPEALQKRMRRGDIYPMERAERALAQFLPPGQPDCSARTGAAAGGAGRGPQPGSLSARRKHRAAIAGGARAHRRLHQFQSRGAISHRARCPHGARDRR